MYNLANRVSLLMNLILICSQNITCMHTTQTHCLSLSPGSLTVHTPKLTLPQHDKHLNHPSTLPAQSQTTVVWRIIFSVHPNPEAGNVCSHVCPVRPYKSSLRMLMCRAVMFGSELALSTRPWPMCSYSLPARSAVAERSSPDPDPPPTPGTFSKCHSSGSTCSTICLGFLSYTRSTRSARTKNTSVREWKVLCFKVFLTQYPLQSVHNSP